MMAIADVDQFGSNNTSTILQTAPGSGPMAVQAAR